MVGLSCQTIFPWTGLLLGVVDSRNMSTYQTVVVVVVVEVILVKVVVIGTIPLSHDNKHLLYAWQQTRLPRTRRTGGTLLHRASLSHAIAIPPRAAYKGKAC